MISSSFSRNTTNTTNGNTKSIKNNNNASNSNNIKGGVKLSTDPQSVGARERRHRISERFTTLQSLVPGGAKLDTVPMLEQTIQYVKFLKSQIWLHQAVIINNNTTNNNYSYDHNYSSNDNCDQCCYPIMYDHCGYSRESREGGPLAVEGDGCGCCYLNNNYDN